MKHFDTIFDGREVLRAMQDQDRLVPISAKLENSLREIGGYYASHHAGMTRQTHNGLKTTIAILTAALEAETIAARRRCVEEAAKGQIGPRPVLRAVE